jgi:uncharacterized membrane protein YbhN (UPF0104 family)
VTINLVLAALGFICIALSVYRLRECWVTEVAWKAGDPSRRSEDPITYWMIVGLYVVGVGFGAMLVAPGAYVFAETYF